MEVPRLGVELGCICWPTPQPQQRCIQDMSVTYPVAHSSTGFLTHWVRPGIKPASSLILVGFVSTAPQWELFFFFFNLKNVFKFFCFLGPHPQHMEVPRLGVESELQLLAYTMATAMPDPSHICDLHHSSWQRQVLNPLIEAKDQTCILMHASQIHFHWAMMGTPLL